MVTDTAACHSQVPLPGSCAHSHQSLSCDLLEKVLELGGTILVFLALSLSAFLLSFSSPLTPNLAYLSGFYRCPYQPQGDKLFECPHFISQGY